MLQSVSVTSKSSLLVSSCDFGRYNGKRRSSHLVFASIERSKEGISIDPKVETLLDSIKWDNKGLAVAIAQNVDTGAILMQGFANRDAVATTMSSRKATFYSRSRSTLWTKGETSKNFINIHDVFLDCDHNIPWDGPTCHTGSETCYYTPVSDLLKDHEGNKLALTSFVYWLTTTCCAKKSEKRQTKLCHTLQENEDKSRTVSEMADVLYHAMVLLAVKDVKVEDVLEILRQRFSKSGIEEKRSRGSHKLGEDRNVNLPG
ncbi:histidine biosynthesis bifunctional protein hisIE, chloroplastic [Quillaja saponaria]|uniref:Histidine biosynthesis bifunctional protein hisIE, chloroplastic n=1 Tax=Quillaja saponaria TaxID=32244 RepID=A0AAD7VI29_QUISA|nr:histidine biosynthesis bifunctional protein hisIE, chloroplastic [Quillaja saponaria]